MANNPTSADTPLGWINSTNNSAYTTNAGEFEMSFAKLAVNETIDVLNFREEILQSNQALTGKSGDLNGNKLELHYGITPSLSLFYRRQQQEITLDIAEIGSIDLVSKDDNLSPTLQTAAIKWTFYERNLLRSDNRRSAAAFELSASSSQSDDFGVTIKKLRLNDIEFIFRDPQTFSVVDLEDEGWKARLVYSFEMGGLGIGSFWTGYGESRSTSGTSSDLTSASLKSLFEQTFQTKEQYTYFGVSLYSFITPRLQTNISYEYLDLTHYNLKKISNLNGAQLPGFLNADVQIPAAGNQTLSARIAYWLTPRVNISITGNLYSNQFLGIIPHFNNPLSGSLADLPYGFIGLEIGTQF